MKFLNLIFYHFCCTLILAQGPYSGGVGASTAHVWSDLHPSRPVDVTKRVGIFPNAVRLGQNLTVRSWVEAELVASLKIYNAMGQVIYYTQSLRLDRFNQFVEIPTSNLAAGHYFVHVVDSRGDFAIPHKIIVVP